MELRSRPTVNDLAREAGVSLATVDRVLNDRPGVRAKTIQAVQDAIARIGYVRDVAAANLARQRDYRLAFVLPDRDSQFNQTLLDALAEAHRQSATARTDVLLRRFPPEDPHALAGILAALPGEGVGGVAVMAPETPILRDAIRGLRQKGIAVLALVSDLPNTERDHFVGIDNSAAGRTAAVLTGRFLGRGPAQVLVIADSMLLRESVERRLGFDALMQSRFPQIEVLPSIEAHGQPATLCAALGESFARHPDIRAVYNLGAGQRALTRCLAEMGLTGHCIVIGHELTPHARESLKSGAMDAVITQNVGHVVRSALRVLRAKIDRVPIDSSQEQIRIEIVIGENLPETLPARLQAAE
ncbi:MAG: LacI family transcriptional regulator [Cereibacter sphaeroides]|uniref:LacI family transcriptional regulator n=1 Tax=Cereibacter sphaeroides TaxID=1063 RepID=A0A2W5UQ15_CERSP|nr:MAG: LacI family transcriptional regulator [Cereibacter sphaeroides]